MTSHLNLYYFYTTLSCFPYRKGRSKTKSTWWLKLKCQSRNKRESQKLSEAIELFRYLFLTLHLLSHNTKPYSLATISSPLIAVHLPNFLRNFSIGQTFTSYEATYCANWLKLTVPPCKG